MLAVATVTAKRKRGNMQCLAPHLAAGGRWGQTGTARGPAPVRSAGSQVVLSSPQCPDWSSRDLGPSGRGFPGRGQTEDRLGGPSSSTF